MDTATFLKRDGFTMMPALPKEAGQYLILLKFKETGNVSYCTERVLEHVIDFFEKGDPYFTSFRESENIIPLAWAKLPDIPKWAYEKEKNDEAI